jgi:general secretion pathway protein M
VIEGLRHWWTGLSRRERAVTAIGGALVLVILLYFAALEPAWRARARLAAELPRLRAEAAEIEALALEAKKLRPRALGVESPAQMKSALERLLAEKQIAGGSIREGEDRRLLLTLRSAEAGACIAWLKDVSTELPLRVSTARISRAGPGLVDADIALAPPGQK